MYRLTYLQVLAKITILRFQAPQQLILTPTLWMNSHSAMEAIDLNHFNLDTKDWSCKKDERSMKALRAVLIIFLIVFEKGESVISVSESALGKSF